MGHLDSLGKGKYSITWAIFHRQVAKEGGIAGEAQKSCWDSRDNLFLLPSNNLAQPCAASVAPLQKDEKLLDCWTPFQHVALRMKHNFQPDLVA